MDLRPISMKCARSKRGIARRRLPCRAAKDARDERRVVGHVPGRLEEVLKTPAVLYLLEQRVQEVVTLVEAHELAARRKRISISDR